MSSLSDARRKDLDALVEANKVVGAAMQTLARRRIEMLTQALQSLQPETGEPPAGGEDPEISRHGLASRDLVAKAIADMKELAEVSLNAQADALAHIKQRLSEREKERQQFVRRQLERARWMARIWWSATDVRNDDRRRLL